MKKLTLNKCIIEEANSTVVNKSNIVLNNDHKVLLSHGLNFVPTPKWNNNLKDNEWLRLMQHIRTVEWQNVFNNNDNKTTLKQQINLPTKLKIQKHNRPLSVQVYLFNKSQCFTDYIGGRFFLNKTTYYILHNFFVFLLTKRHFLQSVL